MDFTWTSQKPACLWAMNPRTEKLVQLLSRQVHRPSLEDVHTQERSAVWFQLDLTSSAACCWICCSCPTRSDVDSQPAREQIRDQTDRTQLMNSNPTADNGIRLFLVIQTSLGPAFVTHPDHNQGLLTWLFRLFYWASGFNCSSVLTTVS